MEIIISGYVIIKDKKLVVKEDSTIKNMSGYSICICIDIDVCVCYINIYKIYINIYIYIIYI